MKPLTVRSSLRPQAAGVTKQRPSTPAGSTMVELSLEELRHVAGGVDGTHNLNTSGSFIDLGPDNVQK